jgi:hypothetical protein
MPFVNTFDLFFFLATARIPMLQAKINPQVRDALAGWYEQRMGSQPPMAMAKQGHAR